MVFKSALTVAIVGRPNVGKSTLFNRLVGHKAAIVLDQPGVTRDWQQEEVDWQGLRFQLIDTAGFEQTMADSVAKKAQLASWSILAKSDLILFVVDARAGLINDDFDIARQLRKLSKPIILVVNKAEGNVNPELTQMIAKIAIGEGVYVSAEHNIGLADLYHAIQPYFTETYQQSSDNHLSIQENLQEAESSKRDIKLVIVGRPNVGKSSIVNAFLQDERVITSPVAGTTRDTIWVNWQYQERQFQLIDTAGIRKKANVHHELEKLSIDETKKAIKQAHVVLLVIDAVSEFEQQDITIANMADEEGKPLVIALNKWDVVQDKNECMVNFRKKLQQSLPQNKGLRFVPVSAQSRFNLYLLLDEVIQIFDVWNSQFSQKQLENWLGDALYQMSPPLISRRPWLIKGVKQVGVRPLTILILSNFQDNIPEAYHKYLINRLRENFDLRGVPVRLRYTKKFTAKKQPK